MNDLKTALQTHAWGLSGYTTRPMLDQMMKSHINSTEAKALWEQYCPWSDTNGGYVKWQKMIDNIKAGAEINAGDGGYSIGTEEKYNEAVKIRNQNMSKE